MKKILIITVLLLTFWVEKTSAQGKIEFKEMEYNFGDILEDGGDVIHEFSFTNKGDKPIIIQNVQASCGCTTPNWTKEPVQPNQASKITAKYSPKFRPGAFNKAITVYSDAQNSTIVLIIKGNVVTKLPDPEIKKFEQTFDQQAFQVDPSSADFKAFVDQIGKYVAKKDSVTLLIEGNALTVTPKKLDYNKKLTEKRIADFKQKLTTALQTQNVNLTKIKMVEKGVYEPVLMRGTKNAKPEDYAKFQYIRALQIK